MFHQFSCQSIPSHPVVMMMMMMLLLMLV